MPEGPSLILVKEKIIKFKGEKITGVGGNASVDINSINGDTLRGIRTWGKQLLLQLNHSTIRIHFLLFGTYSVDEQTKPDRSLRLRLEFANGKIYFYTCSVRMLPKKITGLYDWEADVLSKKWNPARAKMKLKSMHEVMVCDALLDQAVFAGVGNIIKNEVLYRIRLHPETRIKDIPARKLSELIREARQYSFDFLKWKRAFVLRKNWLIHTKKICKRCQVPVQKKYCGETKRRTFFCSNCQILYPETGKK